MLYAILNSIVCLLCVCNMVIAKSTFDSFTLLPQSLPFTSLPTLSPHSTSHATTPALPLSPKTFFHNFLSRCRSYHISLMNCLPGRAYIWAEYLRTLPPSTSGRVFLDSVVALVSNRGIIRVPLNPEDELAAMQAWCRQSHRSVAEVRVLGQLKSTKVCTI